jgi:glycosyltransferase involved in cell wall biosynthesis
VDPLNPTAIAGAILRLMRNPVEAREMGVRGRQAVIDTYNWEHERVKLAGLYDRLSRKKRR